MDCYLKVSFRVGTLEIPSLTVEETTSARLRNLIALEQCCGGNVGDCATAYSVFMDNITSNPRDVAVLWSRGIPESTLGSDAEVADLLNSLCKDTHLKYEKAYPSLQGSDGFLPMRPPPPLSSAQSPSPSHRPSPPSTLSSGGHPSVVDLTPSGPLLPVRHRRPQLLPVTNRTARRKPSEPPIRTRSTHLIGTDPSHPIRPISPPDSSHPARPLRPPGLSRPSRQPD